MEGLVNLVMRLNVRQRIALGACAVILPFAIYGLTVYFGFRNHPFFNTPERINGWAFLTSIASIIGLLTVYGFVRMWVPGATAPAPDAPSLTPPRRIKVVGFVLAALFVALCLPATFRATSHPREVMIFWHDEGMTLELVQAFVDGEKDVPTYRFTQGWVTFLPVALALKALNCFVPVHFTLTNLALRFYCLGVIFFIMYFTYRLVWQVTRSWWLAAAVVVIAYSRPEFFYITLAIDRPDTFQLLFVLLSLMYAHRFWVEGQPTAWFLAVFFAAFAFASKYAGHILAPTLLLPWIAHWRRPEVQLAYASRFKYWAAGIVLFVLSMGIVFPFTFSVLSPYHLINLREVLHFFRTHLAIYMRPNIYNDPTYVDPSHIRLWWGVFTSGFAFDFWLTILGVVGALLAGLKNGILREATPRAKGEWLLLTWGVSYISFLVYQYGLVDYRYIMPAQFVLPYFLLAPILWLQQATVVGRVPYRTVLGFTAITAVFLLCGLRINSTLGFLGRFRSEASMQQCFDVGRYLDRTVSMDDNPKILMTNLAYIPPRFTKLWVNNVDVTNEFIAENQFDYVIITSNMYKIYADKPTKGAEKQYDPLYKVYYPDVVNTYTAFKHNNHPDYRFVESFGDYLYLYERIDRPKPGERVSSTK